MSRQTDGPRSPQSSHRQCTLRRRVMGEWKDKLEGKGKQLKGKVTGDRTEEMKGKAQEAWGDVEGKVGDLKDAWNRRDAERSETGESDRPLAGEGYQPGEE